VSPTQVLGLPVLLALGGVVGLVLLGLAVAGALRSRQRFDSSALRRLADELTLTRIAIPGGRRPWFAGTAGGRPYAITGAARSRLTMVPGYEPVLRIVLEVRSPVPPGGQVVRAYCATGSLATFDSAFVVKGMAAPAETIRAAMLAFARGGQDRPPRLPWPVAGRNLWLRGPGARRPFPRAPALLEHDVGGLAGLTGPAVRTVVAELAAVAAAAEGRASGGREGRGPASGVEG
jgi:hypothetical protein